MHRAIVAAVLRALVAAACAMPLAASAAPGVPFERIQEACVHTGVLPIGPGERWASCRVTRAGFVGTIGLLDFYYATWCLAVRGERCDSVALVVFANRAYRQEATLQFHRVDPAGTRYGHAMMVGGDASHAIVVSARRPNHGIERQFHAWDGAGWREVDGAAWRGTLAEAMQARLPAELRAQLPREAMPEPERMALVVPLRRVRDGALAGVATVGVRIDGTRLAVDEIDLGAARW